MIKALWLILLICVCTIILMEVNIQTGGELSKVRVYGSPDGSIMWITIRGKNYYF